MSNVSDVAAATGARTYEEYLQSSRAANKTMGKTEFLQLLAAQLQYQNPLEPMNDSDFVAQLAQFSSLEQMENLNTTMANSQYYNYAGKYVAADVKLEDGRVGTVVGVVDSVFTKNGTSYAEIANCIFYDEDGNMSQLEKAIIVESASINQVYDSNLFNSNLGGKEITLLDASALIGRTITAKLSNETEVQKLDEDGNPMYDEETGEPIMEKQAGSEDITGRVTRVALTSEGMFAYIGEGANEIAVPIGNIVDIKE